MVPLVLIRCLGVEVDALIIDLPYFNECVAEGVAFCIHDHAAKVGYCPDCGRELVIYEEEVIVRVER